MHVNYISIKLFLKKIERDLLQEIDFMHLWRLTRQVGNLWGRSGRAGWNSLARARLLCTWEDVFFPKEA